MRTIDNWMSISALTIIVVANCYGRQEWEVMPRVFQADAILVVDEVDQLGSHFRHVYGMLKQADGRYVIKCESYVPSDAAPRFDGYLWRIDVPAAVHRRPQIAAKEAFYLKVASGDLLVDSTYKWDSNLWFGGLGAIVL